MREAELDAEGRRSRFGFGAEETRAADVRRLGPSVRALGHEHDEVVGERRERGGLGVEAQRARASS